MSSSSFFSTEDDDDVFDPIVVEDADVLDVLLHETFKARPEGLREMRECIFKQRRPSEGVFIQLPSVIQIDSKKIRYIFFDAALLKKDILPPSSLNAGLLHFSLPLSLFPSITRFVRMRVCVFEQ